ncbi:hypothetical protein JMUB6875_18490 [Nocardia sp. JMUB6875]|uniref:hypothetical protein n=1 Tax=Nocardia sp. JMUB6875 TaxID=3158170 RepID=UPI0032E71890
MSQYLPLIGVLVGGVLTFAGGFVAELVRWNRTQAVRWDERRQAVYAEYASAVKAETILYLKIANAKGVFPGQNTGTAELSELFALLAVAEHTRTERFAIVQLIGAPPVIDAARAWHPRFGESERYSLLTPMEASHALRSSTMLRSWPATSSTDRHGLTSGCRAT